jgi:quinoprotein glucose dehydrogenase
LNRGTIKWQVPVGEHSMGEREPGFQSDRSGMVVTASGLIFYAAADGKLRAYDADNGRVLWSADLPAGSRGSPVMYEVGGKQYLVVNAGQNAPLATRGQAAGPPARAFVAFALP